MTEFFLNPWFMVAGGALVLAPIIIHLINRMRFKRVRWAAMEFLLKSQKRNRRRLIIEQLILLALRCLLVLLVAFLVSRFIGMSLAFMRKQSTLHVVVLDDTPSMGDRWKEKGVSPTNSFEEAKRLLRDKIARNAAQASSVQHMKVFLLSDLETPIFDDRLNDESLKKLAKELDDKAKDPSDVHVPPLAGVQKARAIFGEKSFDAGEHVFHFLSDFRERDWKEERSKDLQVELAALAEKAKVYLVDTADPNRGDSPRQLLVFHDNIGIVDLRPQVAVVPENEPIKLFLTINNFTNKKFENLNLTVKVNNEVRFEATQPLQNLPPGLSTHRFQLAFNKQGFNLIQATLDDPNEMSETGLKIDNDRFAVVEVRNMVDILVIDGDNPNPSKDPSKAPETSGTYFLEKVLGTSKGYRVVPGRMEDLLKPNLAQYPCIYLVNVAEIKDLELDNLDKYVKGGGGVCFFMGDKVKPAEYNRLLYKEGQGLFPAPLLERPTEEKVSPDEMVPRLLNREPNLLVRTPTHPLFTSVYEEDTEHKTDAFFVFLNIEKYYQVPRVRWQKSEQVAELFTLPNRKSLESYRGPAIKLIQEIPVDDDRFKEFRPGLERHQKELISGLTRGYTQLFELANAIYALLHDSGKEADPDKPNEPSRPNLVEFWAKKEVEDLRKRLEEFSDTVRYGDPLLVSKLYGQGRVVACLTSGSTKWNDWAAGPAAPSYVVFMSALRKYLTSVTQSPSYEVGTAVTVSVPDAYYEGKADIFLQPLEPRTDKLNGSETDDEKDKKLMDLKAHQEVPPRDGLDTFTFKGANKAGLYLFKLYPKPQEGVAKTVPEKRAFVFNVDTTAEGDLRRTASDALARDATGVGDQGKIALLHPLSDFSALSNRQTDMSESPWLYLLLLVVLVIEQALAVHLSFHTKAGATAAPSAIPAGVPSAPVPEEEAVPV